jgi:hypothetical protein
VSCGDGRIGAARPAATIDRRPIPPRYLINHSRQLDSIAARPSVSPVRSDRQKLCVHQRVEDFFTDRRVDAAQPLHLRWLQLHTRHFQILAAHLFACALQSRVPTTLRGWGSYRSLFGMNGGAHGGSDCQPRNGVVATGCNKRHDRRRRPRFPLCKNRRLLIKAPVILICVCDEQQRNLAASCTRMERDRSRENPGNPLPNSRRRCEPPQPRRLFCTRRFCEMRPPAWMTVSPYTTRGATGAPVPTV